MKKIKKREEYEAYPKRYKSNDGAILHNDAKSPDVISRMTKVPEKESTDRLTEAMVIGYGIIKKGDVVDVLPDTSYGNNILSGTGWVKKLYKFNNGLTATSVKLDVDGLLYHNIPLKY